MTTTIVIISVLLILAILFLLFRIQIFISVMKGTYEKRVDSSNKVNAFLFILFLIAGTIGFFWISDVASEGYLPEAATAHGVKLDEMFWFTMGILVFAFLLTNLLLFYFAFRYQYNEDRKAYYYPENHRLELVWTVIPAIVLSILVFRGWREWSAITAPEPKNSEIIEIMGKQFAWEIRYPGPDGKLGNYHYTLMDAENSMGLDFSDPNSLDDFMPAQIYVPKGRPVVFKIRARDVLHSVFVPHFRLKMDAVPGTPTTFWFTPTITTQEMRDRLGNPNFNYELACTEICGRGHFAMRRIVVVVEPEQYEDWKRQQRSFAALNLDYVTPRVPAKHRNLLPTEPATELPVEEEPADDVDAAAMPEGDEANAAEGAAEGDTDGVQ